MPTYLALQRVHLASIMTVIHNTGTTAARMCATPEERGECGGTTCLPESRIGPA